MSKRRSGILIHPISFPGPYGCGDLGKGAYQVVDLLKEAGQSILQVLPLGPTGYGDSPYQAFSAFAGTPYLISFDLLIEQGYLSKTDLSDYPDYFPGRVDYGSIYIHNFKVLRRAYSNFKKADTNPEFTNFCSINSYWLDDYSLFMAIKDSKNGTSWDVWEEELRLRTNLDNLSDEVMEDAGFFKFCQYEFYRQWNIFKKYANDQGIIIVGDAPIFVSYDSSDVWANQELFYLDKEGKPEIVAGVPPDYFSKTGQLWGNPHYRWDVMKKNNFSWWIKRINHLIETVDSVRIDHFRGFEASWEIPYGDKTAEHGKWVEAPGDDLFETLKKEFGARFKEVLIAEDLGVITDKVRDLRDKFELPGMRVFEFSPFHKGEFTDYDGNELDNSFHPFLPENYVENCIAYPGTHDNDVLHGWFHSQSIENQRDIMNYLKIDDPADLNFAVFKRMMDSKAKWTVFLMQDLLKLTSDTRLNSPGTCGHHNWSWRLTNRLIEENKESIIKLRKITEETGRL